MGSCISRALVKAVVHSDQSEKLTTLLHIMPMLRMCGARVPFSYTYSWCRDSFTFFVLHSDVTSRDSSVSIAQGYGLDDQGSRVQFLVGAGNFSLHHRVQNGSGAHPASYSMGMRGSFLGGEVAGP
jgi:hypothetical protein